MRREEENPIPAAERIAVDATTAAQLLSMGRSTFYAKVNAGIYPRCGKDGRWRVADLLAAAGAGEKASPGTRE